MTGTTGIIHAANCGSRHFDNHVCNCGAEDNSIGKPLDNPDALSPAQDVLDHAASRNLKMVVVLGWDEKNDLYFGANNMKCHEANWLIDVGKDYLMRNSVDRSIVDVEDDPPSSTS